MDHQVKSKTNLDVQSARCLAAEFESKLQRVEASSMHGQLPIIWDKAEDFYVFDPLGNKYIDFTSGIFIANAGHNNPKIKAALLEAMEGPISTYTYMNKPRLNYLEYLIENTPSQFEKAFLLSAGTETTEAALKLIKLYGLKKGYKKNIVLSFTGNWHGRTVGAQLLSGNPQQREWIDIESDNSILHLPFPLPWDDLDPENTYQSFSNNLGNLAQKYGFDPENDVRGIVMETFQGWGALFYPQSYIDAIKDFMKRSDILLCFDEMQAGFGRTGKLFGYQHYNIEPDLICCGKGISSSLPLSAILGRADILDLPGSGNMSSTHSANPLCCAASHASFKFIVDNNLIDNSKELGELMLAELNRMRETYRNISYISGKGLLAAVHFGEHPQDPEGTPIANKVVDNCLSNGLITVRTGRESIKLGPPLTITKDGMLDALEIFENAIRKSV